MKAHELWILPARPKEMYHGTEAFNRMCRWGGIQVEPKMDGTRCVLVHSDGGISGFSRYGRPIPIHADIAMCAAAIPLNTTMDGELMKKTNELIIFDVMWYAGENITGLRLKDRTSLLDTLPDLGPFRRIRRYPSADLKKALADGHEGLVLKKEDSRYTSGNTSDWIKVKG